eukprot:1623642-Rhodomonas_salina.1
MGKHLSTLVLDIVVNLYRTSVAVHLYRTSQYTCTGHRTARIVPEHLSAASSAPTASFAWYKPRTDAQYRTVQNHSTRPQYKTTVPHSLSTAQKRTSCGVPRRAC